MAENQDPLCFHFWCSDPELVRAGRQWAWILAASFPTYWPVNNLFNLMSQPMWTKSVDKNLNAPLKDGVKKELSPSCGHKINSKWKIQSLSPWKHLTSYKLLNSVAFCNVYRELQLEEVMHVIRRGQRRTIDTCDRFAASLIFSSSTAQSSSALYRCLCVPFLMHKIPTECAQWYTGFYTGCLPFHKINRTI